MPVAVIEYVVVDAGDTVIDPLNGTAPMPWSIATVIAFVDVHVSVVEPPTGTTDGVAVSVTVGGGTTVTRTDAEEAPAVSV